MARGGTAIASASGFDSFFYNPAGFSRSSGEFTLSSSTWFYSRPDLLISQFAQLVAGTANPTATFNFISSQVTKGGFGLGSSYGLGYVANGFGLGVAFIWDSQMWGPTMLGMTGDLTATLGFIGGASIPFDVGAMRIHVGGDIRPMIRVHTPIKNSAATALVNALANGGDLAAPLGASMSVYGSAIGLDLGAIAELWWFSFGLSIRDLGGTTFTYSQNTLGSVTGSLSSRGTFPAGTSVPDSYVIPMDIGVGVTFHPDLGTFAYFLDPRLSIDLRNIGGAIDGSAIFWTCVHAGAEAKVFNMFTLRAGLNQGYLTAGLGVKVFVFDLNMAVFTQELGLHLGDRPNSGITFNGDIKL